MGGLISGIGGAIGASQQASAAKEAAAIQAAAADRAGERALTGYNYLTSGAGAKPATNYINAGQTALGQQGNVQNNMMALLGLGGDPAAAQGAFNNYLGSTGYNFQMDQGQHAITGSAAAKGLLNSGSTAKALTQYGQGLGSQYFQNYLNQLGNMNNTLGGTATAGQNMLNTIAGAGNTGGAAGANAMIQGAANQGAATMQAGNAMSNMYSGLGGALGNTFSNAFGSLF